MALDQDVVNLAKSIRQHESGNKAQLPGEGAELGGKSLYQYTHGTWKSVAGKYLGDQNAQLTRENENKATYLRIADWKKQGYNPAQIASMWNAGEGKPNAYKENWRGVNKYGVKFDTPAYVAKVYDTYKQEKAKTIPPPAPQPQLAQLTQPQAPEKKKSFFDKFADTSGKVLSAGATMLGIPALIENIASIGEAGAYGVNKLLGREQQAQRILDDPISAPQKMAATQGTAAGIKNALGQTIEAGLGASVLATGGLGAAAKGTQVATKAPGFFKTLGTGAKIGAGYGAGFGVAEGLKQNLDTPGIIGEGIKSGALGGLLGGGLGLAGYGLSKVAGKVATSAAARKAGISTKEMVNIAKVEDELYNIENNYAKLRKVNQFEKDAGAASRRRIAESNVLAGSIDENGRIITKGIDGPIERYNKATIGEYENLVGKILEKEGAKVTPTFIAKKLQDTLMKSGLEGNALKTALSRIESEVQGLMLRADQSGLIPLSSVHYAKIATTKGINYATEPFVAAERKAIAKAYKELVEQVSKENIKPINKEIQKYLKDIKLLENLDGKIVKGGKLGKYFSQIAGNLSGAAVGGAIGGPLGMVSGTVVGGELASKIKGKSIQGILGRGQFKTPKKSEVLQKALNEAEARVKVTQKGGKQRVPVEIMPESRPGRLLQAPKPPKLTTPPVIQVEAPLSAGERAKKNIGILAKKLKESNVKTEGAGSLPIKKLLDPEDLMGVDELSYNIPKTDKSFSKGPIDVVKFKDEYIILDGRHRAVESFNKGEKNIDVNILSEKEALKKYTDDWPQLEEIFKPLPKDKGGQKYYSGRNGDIATAENTGMYGNGAYLTSDVERAKLYGKTIDEFNVDGLKLYEPKDTIKELFGKDTNYGDSALITKKYKDLGYDGLKIGGGKDKEIVVFDPKKLNKQPSTPKQGILSKALKDKPGFIGEDFTQEAKILRGTKGLTADDIQKKYPNIKLTKEVPVTDIHGNKSKIASGEVLTPYELKGNKILLQDGETYIVSKNQFNNIKGQSVGGEAKAFAPELEGLEETVKGLKGERRLPRNWKVDKIDDEIAEDIGGNPGDWALFDDTGEPIIPLGQHANKDDAIKMAFDEAETAGVDIVGDFGAARTDAKYASYQLPGGKNYKEILIKAPDKTKKIKPGEWVSASEGIQFINKKPVKGVEFKSSHWDEPNVISHVRMNERTYKGKKVVFMEELQSDWAREFRKNAEFTKTPEINGVPNNPNLKNWQVLSTKRALKEAVDSNAEYFAWINGEQTSARYNLSKQLDSIKWNPHPANPESKTINIKPKEGKSDIIVMINKNGKVTGGDSKFVGKQLDEVIGKGIAQEIISQKNGVLQKEGLNMGGEWAFNLYDRQVKNIVEDLTGAKVEKINLRLTAGGTGSRFNKITERGPNTPLMPVDLKPGLRIQDDSAEWVITQVSGDGKFKAAPKSYVDDIIEEYNFRSSKAEGGDGTKFSDLTKKQQELYIERQRGIHEEDFNIGEKGQLQQGIRLTPEIKARIKGEPLELKNSGIMFQNRLDKPGYVGSDFARSKEGQKFGKTGAGMLLKGSVGLGVVAGAPVAYSTYKASKDKTPQQEKLDTLKGKLPEAGNIKRSGVITRYDPLDPAQTKDNPDGIGALNRKVEFGDVAVGDRDMLKRAKEALKNKNDLFVIIKGLDIKTPYGVGKFRINDTMNDRFDNQGKIDIALPSTMNKDDLYKYTKMIGNSKLEYEYSR